MKNLDYRPIERVNDIPARELFAQPHVDSRTLRTPIRRERKLEAAAMGENLTIPIMLTVRETAERFNLPVHFVRVCVGNGSFVSVRAGRKFLINAESVVTFLSTGLPQGVASQQAAPQIETTSRIAPISLR